MNRLATAMTQPVQTDAGLLAMQYSFTLPADYDMSIIRQRIASKGRLMDAFSGLRMKAFAYAACDYNQRYSPTNQYAPFYLWQNPGGMQRFLASPGFAALVQSFGWPVIKTWSVLSAQFRDSFPIASWASRELVAIPPYSQLGQLQQQEAEHIGADLASKRILGAISAFEPATWTLVRYKLWCTSPYPFVDTAVQVYQVGYLATGTATLSKEASAY